MRRRVSTWRAVPRLRCSSPASRSRTVMREVGGTRPRRARRTLAWHRHSQPEPPWSGWPITRSVRFCLTGRPNRSMKSSAGTFSSRRVPPSPSGFSSSQSRGMAGREAAWPCGSPKVTARFGLLSSSRATTRWPRSARTRASVPATVVLPEPPFPPMAIFIVLRRYRNGGAVARMTRAERPSRSPPAELVRVKRHEVSDAHRRPARHPFHTVRQPIVPTCAVQLRHRHEMPVHVLRQPRFSQLSLPVFVGDIRVSDLAVQRFRVFPGDPVHVLRPRTGELVYPAQVRPRVGEDGGDYPSDIGCGHRRGLAEPERELDAASVADRRTDEAGAAGLREERSPEESQ